MVRVRRFAFGPLRTVGLTWLVVWILVYQSGQVKTAATLSHPIERLVDTAQLAVDWSALTVSGEILYGRAPSLGELKSWIDGIRARLDPTDDIPELWELVAHEEAGYRSVRYEGRGSGGTHWVISAAHTGADAPVRLAMRREGRGIPADLRAREQAGRRLLQVGAGQPLTSLEARTVLSGRTSVVTTAAVHTSFQELLDAVGHGELRYWNEERGGVRAAAYSPHLGPVRTHTGVAVNLELHLVREGDWYRLTIGTPWLGSVETALATGQLTMYSSLQSGETMATEVR